MIDLRGLFLDQSIHSCGWCLFDRGAVTSGAWPLAPSIERRGAAFFELRKHITRIHKMDERGLDLIAVETPILTRADKPEKLIALYGLVASVEAWAWPKKVPVISVDQTKHRKSWLLLKRGQAKGDEWKRLAILRARQYGFDPRTHDEAEAIAIMDHVLLSRKIKPEWREAHPFLTTLT